jgi:ferritin-like metal-binding protein YciE
MAKAAQSKDLKAAFEEHETQTEQHIARLEQVFEEIDASPRGKTCDAIRGSIEEGREIIKEFKGTSALDAGLLAAAQAVEHYEIARYGTLRTWAELGLRNSVNFSKPRSAKRRGRIRRKLAKAEVNQHARAA